MGEDTEALEPTPPPPDTAWSEDLEFVAVPPATERVELPAVTPDITDTHARDALGHWLPGQSGNGKGRTPDKYTLSGTLKAKLKLPADPDDPDGPTVAEALAEQWIKLGLGGDAKALEALSSRVEGKPAQAVSLSLDGSSPLHHQVNVRSSPRIAPPADDDA